MIRRNFIKGFSLLGAGGLLSYKAAALSQPVSDKPASEREYWTDMLSRITLPVLEALSQGKLKERMPVEAAPGTLEGRKKVTYLEALGRSLAGLAPWLELGADETKEGKLREKMIGLSMAAIQNAVTPSSPDVMNFTKENQ